MRNLVFLLVMIAGAILLNWMWGPRPTNALELPWQRVTSQEGGFTIEMPGVPAARSEAQRMLLFLKVQVTGYELKVDRLSANFFAYRYDSPLFVAAEDDAGSLLEHMGKGACASQKGRMVSLQPIDLEGHVGREVRYEFTQNQHDYMYIARLYFVNRRVYHTVVVISRYYAASETVGRYLDSFELLRQEPL